MEPSDVAMAMGWSTATPSPLWQGAARGMVMIIEREREREGSSPYMVQSEARSGVPSTVYLFFLGYVRNVQR
jgi:hypothetical protein